MIQFRYAILSFFLLFLVGCTDCIRGEGEQIVQKRSVENYDVIFISGSFDVVVKQTNGINTIEVNAQENLMPYLLTNVHNKRLEITASECLQSSESILIEVSTSGIVKLINEGSGDVNGLGALKGEELKIVNDGSGNVHLKFKGEELTVLNDGSGDITCTGEVNELTIELEGSGDVNMIDLKALIAKVQSDGSGKVSFYAKDEIDVELNGSGDVDYKGNPENSAKEVSGSGSIRNID
ncbi:MAG: head GIN domain-containing protein [Flavobacteriales bacterium]